MKEIIFSEIKDELIGALEYLGFRLERKLIVCSLLGNPDYMEPEWELLDGIRVSHHVKAVESSNDFYIQMHSPRNKFSVVIKSLSTGEIKELSLKHLMPELFE